MVRKIARILRFPSKLKLLRNQTNLIRHKPHKKTKILRKLKMAINGSKHQLKFLL